MSISLFWQIQLIAYSQKILSFKLNQRNFISFRSVFPITGALCRSKMYKTSGAADLHFAEIIYVLILRFKKLCVSLYTRQMIKLYVYLSIICFRSINWHFSLKKNVNISFCCLDWKKIGFGKLSWWKQSVNIHFTHISNTKKLLF
jgi:hypothetical protein